jgi:hypothetical protein
VKVLAAAIESLVVDPLCLLIFVPFSGRVSLFGSRYFHLLTTNFSVRTHCVLLTEIERAYWIILWKLED